jgi:FMN phosphatase YigB (HAD superfamily)
VSKIKINLFDVDKVLVQNLSDAHWQDVSFFLKERYGITITGEDFYQKIYYLNNKNRVLNGVQDGLMTGQQYVDEVNSALKAYGSNHQFSLEEYYRLVFADRLNTCPQMAKCLADEIKSFRAKYPSIQLGLITDRMHGDGPIFKELLNRLYPGIFNHDHLNFFSSEVGRSKRSKNLFSYVINQLKAYGYQPSEILVIDDREENRREALCAGFKAREFLWGWPEGSLTDVLTTEI